MIVVSERWLVRAAAVAAVVAALGLSGCGRKGPLDLPPGASAVPVQEPVQEPLPGQVPSAVQPTGLPGQGSQPGIVGRGSSPTAPPPSGRGGPFFLDWLLN